MSEIKIIARNKKAFFNYNISEKIEAGIQLLGTEVKSIKTKGASLIDSYAKFDKKGELYVHNMHIPKYDFGNLMNHDPLRRRKLLLHKRELLKLKKMQERESYIIVPLTLYVKKGIIKLELGVGKSKRKFDKREAIKKREAQRKIESSLKFKK